MRAIRLMLTAGSLTEYTPPPPIIAVVGSPVVGTSGSFGSSCTMSVSPSGSNKALVVLVAWQSFGAAPSSVVFNTSENLTIIAEEEATSSRALGAYILLNPTSTTANVVVTWAGTGFGTAVAQAFTGVNQSSPTTGWTAVLDQTSGSISQTASSVGSDDYVIDVVSSVGDSAANSMGGGQVELVNQGRGVASGAGGIFSSYKTGGSGSVSNTWTQDVANYSGGIFRLLPI